MNEIDVPCCTEKCKSVQHGDIIAAAISKRSISDTDLCSYLNYICVCCQSVRDSVGRTALHVAASCGRAVLVRWLIEKRHANINARDEESGYTALHRSIFYGKIDVAVLLIQLGADTNLLDSDSLTILEHAMKDGIKPDQSCNFGEIYTWGSNTNNLLGPQQARNIPELLDIFHKNYPNEMVQQVCVDQFHSVIIGLSGQVYCCGHSQGGRLGLGATQTVMTPTAVTSGPKDLHSFCKASIARDHSLFITKNGEVFSCGLNTHYVLGLRQPVKQALVPMQLPDFSRKVTGICSGKYHSVAWGPDCIYVWGLNAGQLGGMVDHKIYKHIQIPKLLKEINFRESNIKAVASSDCAISIYIEKGDVYILHEYKIRKIASRQLNLTQISVVGGKLNKSIDRELENEVTRELKVVALTNTGNLLLWQESDPQLCRCIFSINRAIIIRQVTVNINGVLFVTNDGEVFLGDIRPRRKKGLVNEKNQFHRFLDREDCISIRLKKIPRIHRAVYISSDLKGKDFCVIQALPYKELTYERQTIISMKTQFMSLLQEADETDGIHDVIFQIGVRIFPAHKYIISTKTTFFEKDFKSNDSIINLDKKLNCDLFEQFLLFIYTDSCELTKCGEIKNLKLRQICDDPTTKNPVRALHEMSKKFGCSDLSKILSNLDMYKYEIRSKSSTIIKVNTIEQFDRTILANLYDVKIICKEGKSILAHKCILAARLDYFNNMFSMRWHGTNKTEISLDFPKIIVETLIEYLYTDKINFKAINEADLLLKLLVLSDQLFVVNLKEECELYLTNLLTLKNIVQFLTFAYMYNAVILKSVCLKFIVDNLTAMLELGTLEELNTELLQELSTFYFQEKKEIHCRVITPYSTAVSDEEILLISSQYPVSMDIEIEKVTPPKSAQKRRSRMHKHHNTSNKNSISETDNLDTIIQFPDTPELSSSVDKDHRLNDITNRLKAIVNATNILEDDIFEPEFTTLSPRKNGDNLELSDSVVSTEDFPELSSPPPSAGSYGKHFKTETKHKPVKLSQKQKKRLSSESNNNVPHSPESPKNPWKILPNISQCSNSQIECNINNIILDEKKQRENLVKIQTKQLIFTQIEDKAIIELQRFYNCDNIFDEIISVERVAIGNVASPVWVPKTK